MGHHRRSFLRRSIALGGATVMGSFAGCARSGESLGDAVDGGDEPTAASDLRLRPGLEIGLGSTAIAGLAGPSEVDPDEPGGGRLVTVDAVDPGQQVTLSWRQTVEREIPPTQTTVGVGESTPTAAIELVEETGTITATGLQAAHEPFLPMYWRPGERETDSSAMWLSREAFRELKDTRQTAWSRDVLTRISRIGEEAIERIQSGTADRIRDGVAEVEEVYLNAEPDLVDFEVAVNGQSKTVSAIEAYDSFGNGYRIIDDERNPLVAKFTYDAVSVGFTGFDTAVWTLIKTVFSGYRVVSIDAP